MLTEPSYINSVAVYCAPENRPCANDDVFKSASYKRNLHLIFSPLNLNLHHRNFSEEVDIEVKK